MDVISGNNNILLKAIPDDNTASIDATSCYLTSVNGNSIYRTLCQDSSNSCCIKQAKVLQIKAIIICCRPYAGISTYSILYFEIAQSNILNTRQNTNTKESDSATFDHDIATKSCCSVNGHRKINGDLLIVCSIIDVNHITSCSIIYGRLNSGETRYDILVVGNIVYQSISTRSAPVKHCSFHLKQSHQRIRIKCSPIERGRSNIQSECRIYI